MITGEQAAPLDTGRPPVTVTQLLVDRGLLSPDLARMAEELARRQGGHLIDTILKQHMVQEDDLARLLAEVNEWELITPGALIESPVLHAPLDQLGRTLAYQTPFVLIGSPAAPTLVLANPYRTDVLDEVGRRLRGVTLRKAVAPRRAILGSLIQAFPTTPQHLARAIEDLERGGLGQNAVGRYMGELIGRAVTLGASDIHVEPGELTTIRFRVAGLLYPEDRTLPAAYHDSLANVIHVLAGLPSGGRYAVKEGRLAWELPSGDPVELRITMTPTLVSHESVKPQVVMRVLHRHQSALPLGQLGYPEDQRRLIEGLAGSPHGLVLFAGQVNTGKTTTLYAILSGLQSPHRKIVTVEDPVECLLGPLVQQHQVNDEAGFTYAAAIRAFLRVDPDAMLVGEIRDPETAIQIVQASLQGRLTFSTLHAESAVHAIPRLLALGVEPLYLASALKGVIAQRLLRTLCPRCRLEGEFSDLHRDHPLWVHRYSGHFQPAEPVCVPAPGGCQGCGGTGYRGLTVVAEVLVIDREIQEDLERRRGTLAVLAHAQRGGFRTMREGALDLVRRGVTDFGEAERVLHPLIDDGRPVSSGPEWGPA